MGRKKYFFMLCAEKLTGTGATEAESQKVQKRRSLTCGQQVHKQIVQDQAGVYLAMGDAT